MDSNGAYAPKRYQTAEEKLAEWQQNVIAVLGLTDQHFSELEQLSTIFNPNNFSDSDGQLALRDVERLKDLRQPAEKIISYLKDKFKFQNI